MSIDRRHIGTSLPAFSVPVEAGRLRFFAKATGNADPVYSDEAAARDAGHPSLPVPPTFFFCLEMDAPDPAALRKRLGIDYRRILHGEQHLRYHAMAYAGDTLRFEPRIADIHDKKGGALEFVRRETRVVNQRGELVAELSCVTVVRHAEPARAAQPAPGHTAGEPAPRSDAVARAVAASHHDIQVGAGLPPLEVEPVSRLTLALYCGASGDHNPIHVDTDYARAAGMDDVIAHGMLAMAYAARLVTGWVPQRAIERLSARFVATTQVGDALRCTATVAEKLPDRRVRLALSVADRNGAAKLVGDAVVVLP